HLREHAPTATAMASAIASAVASVNAPPPVAGRPERTPEEVKAEFLRKTQNAGAQGAASAASPSTAPSAARASTPAAPAGIRLPLETEGLGCRLGVRLGDAKRIAACTEELKKAGADERLVVSFEWSRALILKDKQGAAAILERAKTLHLPDAGMRAMLVEQER